MRGADVDAVYVVTVAVSMLVGFLAGVVAFKRTERWCPGCGATLKCVDCPGNPSPDEVRRMLWQQRT